MSMKRLLLQSLCIRNFKGCVSLNLVLEGRSAAIYGDNATGKTTIYDALTWLLFGKDSQGRGDFEIKPLDANGQVKDHAAVSEVDAAFLVDGYLVKLKKTFYECWSTKRGGAEATYDGNTSEYFVDEVPTKKYEFERRVNELVSEDLFRILANVGWFCMGMDWKLRRKTLLEICEVPEDREIMSIDPRFSGLSAAMGRLSMDDYKKKLIAQRKGLNGARSTIPARLDEQKKNAEALSAIDFTAIEAERSAKAAYLDQLSGELIKLNHGSLIDSKRNEAENLRNQLQKLINENDSYRAGQVVPVTDERPAMAATLARLKEQMLRSARLASNENELISRTEAAIERYRAAWVTADGTQFYPSVCPTCGQNLPAEAQEEARIRFEAEKQRKKDEAVAAADLEKTNLKAAVERREMYINDAAAAENEVSKLEAALQAYVPTAQPEVFDLPGFEEQASALRDQIAALDAEELRLAGESAAIRTEINGKITALRHEIETLDGELAKRSLLNYAKRREEELRQEAKKTAQALEELDKQLFLCEEFTRFKVSYIEDSINDKFQLARFKLFHEQVNGGLADCCEATYDGVPYGSLNNGMRINIGIDVIRTVSDHYGLRVPLVVDNAESVVELLDAGTQVIRLVVSGVDKELRCEYGT